MKMKSVVLGMGLLFGLMAGACDAYQFGEGAPIGDDDSNLILDNDPHLPGSCNNPVTCDTTPQGPKGDNPDQCSGCDCMPSPSTCRGCQIRCGGDYLRCLGAGISDDSCKAAYGPDCDQSCYGGRTLTCACPRH